MPTNLPFEPRHRDRTAIEAVDLAPGPAADPGVSLHDDLAALPWIDPHEGHRALARICDDLGSSALTPRGIPIPDGDQGVRAIHDVSANLRIGFLTTAEIGQLSDFTRPRQQLRELPPRGIRLEVANVVLPGQW
ncbi:MAG: hypothetical protein HW391_718 [Chloroflexi bacterium]|nr:hypothetical protein [Chloroflexota bacterium]